MTDDRESESIITEQDYRSFSNGIYEAIEGPNLRKEDRKIADVMIELTRLCSIKCTHCYIGDARWVKDPNEMSFEEITELLDLLAAKGTLWVCFTGGEALMRKDFKEIWLYAKKKGFILTLFTNATLITEDIASFLAEYPPFRIEVSIYGATEETYERVSKVKGSYKRFIKGIENLRAQEILKWDLKTVYIVENSHELSQMKALAEQWGVDFKFDGVINPSIGQGKSGGNAPCSSRLPVDQVAKEDIGENKEKPELKKILDGIGCSKKNNSDTHKRGTNLFSCSAGLSSAYITADGRLQMCILTKNRAEPLTRQKESIAKRLERAWYNFGEARELKMDPNAPCVDCDLASICDNCPGFASLETGNEQANVEYLCRLTHKKAQLLGLSHECKPSHFVHKRTMNIGKKAELES